MLRSRWPVVCICFERELTGFVLRHGHLMNVLVLFSGLRSLLFVCFERTHRVHNRLEIFFSSLWSAGLGWAGQGLSNNHPQGFQPPSSEVWVGCGFITACRASGLLGVSLQLLGIYLLQALTCSHTNDIDCCAVEPSLSCCRQLLMHLSASSERAQLGELTSFTHRLPASVSYERPHAQHELRCTV